MDGDRSSLDVPPGHSLVPVCLLFTASASFDLISEADGKCTAIRLAAMHDDMVAGFACCAACSHPRAHCVSCHACRDLARLCWQQDPCTRPTATELVNHIKAFMRERGIIARPGQGFATHGRASASALTMSSTAGHGAATPGGKC
jgi:hypothetical protein